MTAVEGTRQAIAFLVENVFGLPSRKLIGSEGIDQFVTLRLCLGYLVVYYLRIVSKLGNVDAERENDTKSLPSSSIPLAPLRSRRGVSLRFFWATFGGFLPSGGEFFWCR
jgi:hypothetical protein